MHKSTSCMHLSLPSVLSEQIGEIITARYAIFINLSPSTFLLPWWLWLTFSLTHPNLPACTASNESNTNNINNCVIPGEWNRSCPHCPRNYCSLQQVDKFNLHGNELKISHQCLISFHSSPPRYLSSPSGWGRREITTDNELKIAAISIWLWRAIHI